MTEPVHNSAGCRITGAPHDTGLRADRPGTISVAGLVSGAAIDPAGVECLRPDVFQPGCFSVFAALVHTCGAAGVEIAYHFDERLRTHVIDSLDGSPHWWYRACYHGTSRLEEPSHRMDTHPYKDWMKVEVCPVQPERADSLRAGWADEADRLERNGGRVTVPEVTVRTLTQDLQFTDVEVRAHDLRSDIFRPGVITALDIMLSAADQGKLSLDVDWLEMIGEALQQGYYINRINDERAGFRTGFTYEVGERRFFQEKRRGFGDNWIHMSADIRIVECPEYTAWRWTDLSGRHRRPKR